jgi:hypothetical protein
MTVGANFGNYQSRRVVFAMYQKLRAVVEDGLADCIAAFEPSVGYGVAPLIRFVRGNKAVNRVSVARVQPSANDYQVPFNVRVFLVGYTLYSIEAELPALCRFMEA